MRAFIALLILLPTVALAADPNALAEKEARSFLRPCKEATDDRQQLCLVNQQNFIMQYVYAKSGDQGGQHSTAESFDTVHLQTKEALLEYVGMPQNQIQSCAWWLVAVQSPNTLGNPAALIHHACDNLDRSLQALAMRRADELLRELRTAPATRGPDAADDWEPAMPGLKPPSSHP